MQAHAAGHAVVPRFTVAEPEHPLVVTAVSFADGINGRAATGSELPGQCQLLFGQPFHARRLYVADYLFAADELRKRAVTDDERSRLCGHERRRQLAFL